MFPIFPSREAGTIRARIHHVAKISQIKIRQSVDDRIGGVQTGRPELDQTATEVIIEGADPSAAIFSAELHGVRAVIQVKLSRSDNSG